MKDALELALQESFDPNMTSQFYPEQIDFELSYSFDRAYPSDALTAYGSQMFNIFELTSKDPPVYQSTPALQ